MLKRVEEPLFFNDRDFVGVVFGESCSRGRYTEGRFFKRFTNGSATFNEQRFKVIPRKRCVGAIEKNAH